MPDSFYNEIGGRGLGVVLGLILGGVGAWLVARWKRHRERSSILRGDARDTVVIHQHLIETSGEGDARLAKTLRIRCVGQAEMSRVVPNGHLASVLLARSFAASSQDTLISMAGAEGSYLLETLTNFVCDRVGNAPFEHDLYIMAPCCEPADLSEHQPITILLIAEADLALFERWPNCREIAVEHGSDGSRVLTLLEMARRYRQEQNTILELRKDGKRTKYVETMYSLDLALDKRSASVATKPVPWGRYESILKAMNLAE